VPADPSLDQKIQFYFRVDSQGSIQQLYSNLATLYVGCGSFIDIVFDPGSFDASPPAYTIGTPDSYYTILGMVSSISPHCPIHAYELSGTPTSDELIYPPTNPTITAACPALPANACSLIEVKAVRRNLSYAFTLTAYSWPDKNNDLASRGSLSKTITMQFVCGLPSQTLTFDEQTYNIDIDNPLPRIGGVIDIYIVLNAGTSNTYTIEFKKFKEQNIHDCFVEDVDLTDNAGLPYSLIG
jgi:hypothetical protein